MQERDFDNIGNIKIINVNHCRYLGVYIDKILNGLNISTSFVINCK